MFLRGTFSQILSPFSKVCSYWKVFFEDLRFWERCDLVTMIGNLWISLITGKYMQNWRNHKSLWILQVMWTLHFSVKAPGLFPKNYQSNVAVRLSVPVLISQKLNMVFLLHWCLIGWDQSEKLLMLIFRKFHFRGLQLIVWCCIVIVDVFKLFSIDIHQNRKTKNGMCIVKRKE